MNRVSFLFTYAFTAAIPVLAFYYLWIPPKDGREALLKRKYIVFLLVAVVAIGVGTVRGIDLRNEHLVQDVIDFITFSFAPGASMAIGLLLRSEKQWQIFNGFLFAACAFILSSYLLLDNRGLFGSFLRGNSTITHYSVYFLAFYGILLFASRITPWVGRGFAAVGIILATFAFGKWTLPVPIIIIPTLLILHRKQLHLRKLFFQYALLSILAVTLIWLVSLTSLPDILAQRIGFFNFAQYWNRRVVNLQSYTEVPIIGLEIAVRDGGRFKMWEDILIRTLQSPIAGIGIGTRPSFFVNPQGVNAHNFFITLLGSYGVPIFCMYLITFASFLRAVRNILLTKKIQISFWAWLVYCFIVLNVGVIHESQPNQLFMFLPLAIILHSWRKAVQTSRIYMPNQSIQSTMITTKRVFSSW